MQAMEGTLLVAGDTILGRLQTDTYDNVIAVMEENFSICHLSLVKNEHDVERVANVAGLVSQVEGLFLTCVVNAELDRCFATFQRLDP